VYFAYRYLLYIKSVVRAGFAANVKENAGK